MALFLSTYENKVDKKGRVSVPASFRTAVGSSHFQGIAVYKHPEIPCLEGADVSFLETLSDVLYEEYGAFDIDPLSVATTILGDAAQLAFDSEGRVLLPAGMKTFTGISEQAVFIGLGRKFQIWAPDRFAIHLAEQRELAKEKVKDLKPFGARNPIGGRS